MSIGAHDGPLSVLADPPHADRLTNLPPATEVTAWDVLNDFRRLGTNIADPDIARAVKASYQIALEHLMTMNLAGELSDEILQQLSNLVIGMHQAVDQAHYAAHNVQPQASSAPVPARAPAAARRSGRRSIWELSGLIDPAN